MDVTRFFALDSPMKYLAILCLIVLPSFPGCARLARPDLLADANKVDRRLRTYANPVDLPYRYQTFTPAFREAADPTVVVFQGRYWMFASHSKGYWYSVDLLHWTFIEPTGYPVDKFAPTVLELSGKLYLAASEYAKKVWVTDDPMTGVWREAADISPGYVDPCLFLDDDGRLYMYDGLSGKDVLRAAELDRKTFEPIDKVTILESRDKERRGWEVVGDHNEKYTASSYIEGSWLTKHNGKYYLQYAAPGTEFKTYSDGVLVADRPMGPFTYQGYSPFSSKPTGFISGAGHGSTFQALAGSWWHAATMTISRRHPFERRLGLFPSSFNPAGELVTDTYLGDYPHYVDGDRTLTGWMLLSRHRAVTASSTLAGFNPELAVDEDVRTWWSAQTGNSGEWFQIDLGATKRVDAVQINFADQDSKGRGISQDVYKYVLEGSPDGKHWRTLINASIAGRDAPHDYEVLPKPEHARFIRIQNVHSPDDSKFSLSDLRVFGTGTARLPQEVAKADGTRGRTDPRKAIISWDPVRDAEFYIVRLGTHAEQLTQSYQVYDGQTSLDVSSLNVEAQYYFAVDAVNEAGIRRARDTRLVK